MIQILDTLPISSIPFAAFDFETTGMDPLSDQIIEIGITIFQKNEILKNFNQLVNPGVPVSKEAFEVHGIGAEALRDKPRLDQVLDEVISLLSDSVPVAHNAPFDVSFLLEACRQNGLAFPVRTVVDSCLLAKALFPDLATHRLSYLTEKFGFECEKAHRALNDSRCCFSLFCRSVEELPLGWETPWEQFRSSAPGVLSLDAGLSAFPEKFIPFRESFRRRERLVLSYQDGKGQVTRREVMPMGFTSDGKKVLLVGYCYLRHGTRTFRLDRILEINKAIE